MDVAYPDLPGWEFTTISLATGEYRVRAVGPGGLTAESGTTEDPDAEQALADLREWARRAPTGGAAPE